MKTLLLITSNPHTPQATHALACAKELLQDGQEVSVFFYGDGAYTANTLMWQSADVPNIRDEWVKLANNHRLALPVCVSTALARGITDKQNATRHTLKADNLHAPFYLVGLSELAMMMTDGVQVRQF